MPNPSGIGGPVPRPSNLPNVIWGRDVLTPFLTNRRERGDLRVLVSRLESTGTLRYSRPVEVRCSGALSPTLVGRVVLANPGTTHRRLARRPRV